MDNTLRINVYKKIIYRPIKQIRGVAVNDDVNSTKETKWSRL